MDRNNKWDRTQDAYFLLQIIQVRDLTHTKRLYPHTTNRSLQMNFPATVINDSKIEKVMS